MKHEIAERQERARKLMDSKGFSALISASAENTQYLTGVTEPSIHACCVAIIPKQSRPVLSVMWLDKEAAEKGWKESEFNPILPTLKEQW